MSSSGQTPSCTLAVRNFVTPPPISPYEKGFPQIEGVAQ